MDKIKELLENGETTLGIEFGSTRIKAVLIGLDGSTIASGNYEWENQLINDFWTYSVDDIILGLQSSYKNMADDVAKNYGVKIKKFKAIGFSGMMHGFMPFDKSFNLLTPFRTWRNTKQEDASAELTELFGFNIPQRWSISHLYQAILNKESYVNEISFITTLAGYIHYRLTGNKVLGIGEASGVFPIDSKTNNYDYLMISKFNDLAKTKGVSFKLEEILPKVLVAGEFAGNLTEEGVKLLDISGELQAGIPLCPPEGDAGTGMTATNSVAVKTGNVSSGTSVFAMIVLEKALSKVYKEIDLVTTPSGKPVAMVHCNNCTSDINAWVNIFREFSELAGLHLTQNELYGMLFKVALQGDEDCGDLMSYNYFSGEHITNFEEGRPLFVRKPDSKFSLANFMRTNLYSALGTLKVGLDILARENIKIERIFGHGGFFKTELVGQKIMAAAVNAPVSVMKTAGEGGAWGIAVLACYMADKRDGETLEDFLSSKIFANGECVTVNQDEKDVEGFNKFIKKYLEGLSIEESAINNFK